MGEVLTARGWWLAVVICVFAGVGCIHEEPEFDVDSGPSSLRDSEERVGAMYAEFRRLDGSTRATDKDSHGVRLHAQFLDVRGLEAETALSALDVWQYPSTLDRDTCSLSAGSASDASNGGQSNFRMRLLDVGPLSVERGAQNLTLEPRRIPDLSRTFSGVVYGMDQTMVTSDDDASPLLSYQPGEEYRFSAPGGRTTAGFEVAVEAPAPVELTRIQSRAASEQWAHLGSKSAVNVQWRVSSQADALEPGQQVFLDVAAVGEGRQLTCRLADDGRFTLPAELITEVAGGDDQLTFVLRRVQSREIPVDGLDETRLTLSATDVRRVPTRTILE